MQIMNKQIAVVGAGITGITTAYYLAQFGYAITVYDEELHPAMRTSYANGGQISVSNSEVWTTWGNVKKGFQWLFQKDAPLLIRLTPSWSKIKWLTQFLWHTVRGDYEKNTTETIRMGLESQQLYSELLDNEKINFDQTASGILHFYKDPVYLTAAKSAEKIYTSNGCDWRMLTPAQFRSLDPALANIDTLGAAWTSTDWTGDIHKFCIELSKVLREKYNVRFCFNTKFLANNADKYDAVVVSAGVGSASLAKQFGDSLSIYPVKGYSVTINNVDPTLLPRVSLLDDQAKIVTSTLGNRFRVAGTAELAGENYDIRRDRITPLLDWIHTNFPQIDTHDYSSWACLRPMTPNMMPIVKKSDRHAKVFYNTGHGHLGWTLAPCTAKQIVKIIKETL
jgi:D-amino-acid dehydrogenase